MNTPSSETPSLHRAQPPAGSDNYLNVTVWVQLSNKYGAFDTNAKHLVPVYLDAKLSTPASASQITISTSISFTSIPPSAFYTFFGSPPVSRLSINIPDGSTSFVAVLKGFILGSSVLWKNSAEIPFVSVVASPVPFEVYLLTVIPPQGARVTTVYVPGLNINATTATLGETTGIIVTEKHPNAPVIVLYEPGSWEAVALGTMIGSAVVIYAFFATALFEPSRAVLGRLTGEISKWWKWLTRVDARKLLSMYLLVAMLMVSLSFSLGPDPRLKVYILATPETTPQIAAALPQGAFALTVRDEMNELGTLTTLGTIPTVIVGDFVPPGADVAELLIFPALSSVQQIVVLQPYAGQFGRDVAQRYPTKTIVLSSLGGLGSLRLLRSGFFNLGLPFSAWSLGAAFVGVCSFALVFVGLVFLSFKLVETGRRPSWAGLSEAVIYVTFYFVFTQMVYIVSSVLLAMPVGLHTSTSKVTVVGLMGLGGGSRPRMLAGILGSLFGSLAAMRGGLKIDKIGLLIATGAVYFVLLDPLTGGRIFYEFVLMFSVGPFLEQSTATWGAVRGFLGIIAQSLGGYISPVFISSLGIVLYYLGSIPLHFLSRLQRTAATVMAALCAFPVGLGAVRVADMAPWKIMASSIPGIMVGLLLAGGFVGLSLSEGLIRERLLPRLRL